jgi:drug/metabolite transporter (DMT)-like permease
MWAFQFSGAKIATEQLGPITVALLPLAIATILLIPLLVIAKRNGVGQNNRAAPGNHAIRNFILLALLGSTPAQVCLTWGVKHSLAADASVLTLTIPVLTAIMAVILLGEKMTALRWVSFAMAIAGVLLVSDIDWKSLQLFHGTYLGGNLLIFGSCLGSAFYNSFSKKLLETFNPVEVLVYSFIVSDIVLFALMLLFEPGSWRALATLDAPVWLSLVLIGLFSLAVSMMMFFWVIQRIDVTQASLSIYLLPVFGVLISAVTLHEKTTVHLIVGGVLVFISTFLVTTYEERLKMKMQKR